VIYGAVTAERVERIVRQHVIDGNPIEEWVISHTPFRG
jgi:(2Fe-2S) ferredoxin